jgi:hypothetical protein
MEVRVGSKRSRAFRTLDDAPLKSKLSAIITNRRSFYVNQPCPILTVVIAPSSLYLTVPPLDWDDAPFHCAGSD